MRCKLAQSAISWCIESTSWLMFMDWSINAIVGVLSRHIGLCLLMHWRVGWYVESTCSLKIHWRVGWCVGLTCWLTITDALTCWLVCWINMLVDYDWCIDILVGMLNQHVGWLSLMHWRVRWCDGLTCWLTITNALTCWLVCWIDMLVDVYWCTGVLVVMLNRHAVCTVLLNSIVADQLLHLVIKRNKKKTICSLHIQSWL